MECKLTDGRLPALVEECLIRAIQEIPFGRITLTMHEGQVCGIYTERRLNVLPKAPDEAEAETPTAHRR